MSGARIASRKYRGKSAKSPCVDLPPEGKYLCCVHPKLRPLTLALRTAMALVVLVLLGMIGWSQRQACLRSRVVSCTNHGNHIRMTMRVNANDGADWEIPYLPGVEGHKLLVAMSVAAYGTAVGGLNCHHGASGFNRGGWQCVNLPKSQWLELLDRWDKSKPTNLIGADGVPIYWCGRSTGTGDRLCVEVRWEHGRHSLNMGRIKEETLVERVAWLNKQLAELGERPVSLDIPPGVDWPAVIQWAQTVTNSFPRRQL